MRTWSTAQAAKIIGVSKNTLLRWLYSGILAEPKKSRMPGSAWRLWTVADIKRAKALKATIKPGRKPKNSGRR
jgi:hypothetical protein